MGKTFVARETGRCCIVIYVRLKVGEQEKIRTCRIHLNASAQQHHQQEKRQQQQTVCHYIA